MHITIFSAHPDDAEFIMGGTLLMLARDHDVTNVILTRGEAGTYGTPAVREAESREAGRIGGYAVRFLDYTDTIIDDTPQSVQTIAAVIRELTPRVIFTTYHTNTASHTDGRAHQDHTALGSITRKAARIAKFRNAPIPGDAHCAERIIYYMIPRYTKPSFVIDVSCEIERLPELWKAYESQTQLRGGALIDSLLVERAARGRDAGVGSAEEFIVEEPLLLTARTLFPEE